MNAGTFEELSRQVVGASTRRQALRYFAAAAGTAVFTFSSATPAGATRCRKNSQPCRESAECCSKFCDPTNDRHVPNCQHETQGRAVKAQRSIEHNVLALQVSNRVLLRVRRDVDQLGFTR